MADLGQLFAETEERYGLPPGYLARTAQIESSNNPNARNPNSSAGGLFQFIDGTAKQYGLSNKFDPLAATDAAGRLARDNANALRSALGREPSASELYLAHQQGAGGAISLLKNPSASVGGDAIALNGGRSGMAGGDFARKWTAKYDGTNLPPVMAGQPKQQGEQPMNPMLMPQQSEQPQQGGLSGLFNPETMAYLQMIIQGLDPRGPRGTDPMQMLMLAQQQKAAQADKQYNRQKDERNFGLQQQQFELSRSDKATDNERADKQFGLSQKQFELSQGGQQYNRQKDERDFDLRQKAEKRLAMSPAAQAAQDLGLEVGSEPYKEFINTFYRKKTDSIENQVAEREKIAETKLGLKKGSPQYQSYVGTGKLGRDEPISAADRKAIMSAEDDLPNLKGTIEVLNAAKELNDKTFTGITAGARGYIGTSIPGGGLLVNKDAALATTEFGKLMSGEAIKTMAGTLKGATTDFELKKFEAMLADPSTPPDIRARTIDRMIKLAEGQLKISTDRINQLRGGEYYKPTGGASAAGSPPQSSVATPAATGSIPAPPPGFQLVK